MRSECDGHDSAKFRVRRNTPTVSTRTPDELLEMSMATPYATKSLFHPHVCGGVVTRVTQLDVDGFVTCILEKAERASNRFRVFVQVILPFFCPDSSVRCDLSRGIAVQDSIDSDFGALANRNPRLVVLVRHGVSTPETRCAFLCDSYKDVQP